MNAEQGEIIQNTYSPYLLSRLLFGYWTETYTEKNSIYFHLFYQHKAGQAKKINSYNVSSSIDSNSFAVLKKNSYQEHTQLVLFSL